MNDARRLRILMVTARYFPAGGGTEMHTREVARRVAIAGHQVTVLTTHPGGQLPFRETSDEGVRIQRVPALNFGNDLHFAPAIARRVRDGGWDVVHCQGYHTLVPPMAMAAALSANIPYVLTFHGGGHSSPLRNRVRGVQRALLRPFLVRADRLIALADFELALFGDRLGIPRDHFIVIPTGADLPTVTDVRPASADPIIASVGRLERYKGHHRVLAALPAILRQEPRARLWIAGSGPYEAELRELAQRLGVTERVDIHAVPSTDRQAMASELSRVALVVLLSEYETQPAAVLEALALGRPALVADTSGLSELASRGLVRAIPLASTPEQVARAVLDQLRDPLLPPSDLQLPTWEQCTTDLIALYTDVVRRRACAF